jgi:hypothetical protein
MIISEFFKHLFVMLSPYLIGATLGVLGTFVTGFVKEFFDERRRISKHKLEVARQVLRICNEASTCNFKSPPRDIEHINSVLTDIEGIDSAQEKILTSFVSRWQIININAQTGNNGLNKLKTEDFVTMINDNEESRKELVSWANTIRVGK